MQLCITRSRSAALRTAKPEAETPCMNELKMASVLPFSRVEPLIMRTRLARFPPLVFIRHCKDDAGELKITLRGSISYMSKIYTSFWERHIIL
jgi:hypothetical protein